MNTVGYDDTHVLQGLMPSRNAPVAQPDWVSAARRTESARGAMVGTAVGDALGRPAEARDPASFRGREEDFRHYQRWSGYVGGPPGTFTDDTQMSICVAESLLSAGGRIDPHDLAQRFVAWLPEGRGKGQTCVDAVWRLQSGAAWWEAGQPSAGNGAAMRVAPIGIALGHDVNALCFDSALSAVVTHADPMAVAGAVGHAWLVARLAAVQPDTLDAASLLDELASAISVIDDPGYPERSWETRPGKTSAAITLASRVREVADLLAWPTERAFSYLYNGAFVLETLPCALWCFLRDVNDPEEGVVTAVLGGRDADTVASMAAAYFGALHGVGAFPDRWCGDNLERWDDLVGLADELAAIPPLR